jgi:Family of unknown function (DUF6455)
MAGWRGAGIMAGSIDLEERAMGILNKLDKSAGLVQDMAGHLDVDLDKMLMGDPETGAFAYRNMVLSCSACTDQDGCRALLDETEKLDAAPKYCRNGHLLTPA